METRRFFILTVLLLFMSGFIIPGISQAKENNECTITDMANRRVVIKAPVKKIVTTFKPSTLCILSLGLEHKLVGLDNSSRHDRLCRAVFPGIERLTGVGTKTIGINFESLVSLKPDLVVLYPQKDGLSLAERLESIDIPSIVIVMETFETIKESMRLIAHTAGEPEKPLMLEKEMERLLNLVEKRLKGLPGDDKKSVYFASSIGMFNTATGNMLQDEIFNNAGVLNVSHNLMGYFQDISMEQLTKWNPDIILISQHQKKSEIKQLDNKALATISAVSRKDVFRCPSNLAPWDFPSPLSVLEILWLAHKVYPERFSDIDFENEVDRFHYKLFGKTFTQMGGILEDEIY